MFGKAIEAMFNKLIPLAGFELGKAELGTQELIKLVPEKFRKRWEKANPNVSLKATSPAFVLDHLYKIDTLLKTSSDLYGLQLTGDPREFAHKTVEVEHLSSSGLYERAGFTATAVILVLEGKSDGFAFWSEEELCLVVEKVQDIVIDLDKHQSRVHTFTLILP